MLLCSTIWFYFIFVQNVWNEGKHCIEIFRFVHLLFLFTSSKVVFGGGLEKRMRVNMRVFCDSTKMKFNQQTIVIWYDQTGIACILHHHHRHHNHRFISMRRHRRWAKCDFRVKNCDRKVERESSCSLRDKQN